MTDETAFWVWLVASVAWAALFVWYVMRDRSSALEVYLVWSLVLGAGGVVCIFQLIRAATAIGGI